MCHIFFIQLSVNGHPDCFHVLAVVNSASMNIGVHMSFSIMVFQGHMPSRGISGSYGGFIPSFSRNLHSVFFTVISIYIPSNCARCFLFLHILTEFIVCRFFFFFWWRPFWLVWDDTSFYVYSSKDMNIIVQLSLPSIFRTFSFTQTLCPLNSKFPFSHRSSPWQHHYTLCPYQFDSFRNLIHVESYNIWPSGSGLFHLISSRFIRTFACVSNTFQWFWKC